MKTTVYIQNLKCGGCATTITDKLSKIENITDINVIVDENAVQFNYTDLIALEKVKETLQKIGYPEDGEANSLATKAKSYVSCAIGKIS
jgi:copper chaperone CopZ